MINPQTQTPARSNDMLARWAVYGLLALAMWAGVRQIERPADSAQAQGTIPVFATDAPAAPTPTLGLPSYGLAAPTMIPEQVALPAPVWPADALAVAPAPAEQNNGDYIANVGAQAPHSPRGDVEPQAPSYEAGPVAYPDQGVIIDPSGVNAPPAGIAVAVPPISAAQVAVLGARESNTCPAGQTFYPRTGCHAEGSGGPQPGAVGEDK